MPTFEGTVEEIVFRNELNGWTVMQLRSGREQLSVVGVMPFANVGERVSVTGEWVEHAQYGRQIKAEQCESLIPTTLNGIERYLASGLIQGIGPATAKLIVFEFGERALDVMESDPERLTEIPGIGPKRAHQIAQSFQGQLEMRRAMVFLQTYGIAPALAVRIYRAYGEATQRMVRETPYALVDTVQGVGFKTADRIALSLGIAPESEARLRCGLKYALDSAAQTAGHMFLPAGELAQEAARLLGVDISLTENALSALALAGDAIKTTVGEVEAVYSRRLFAAEVDVAKRLIALRNAAQCDSAKNVNKSIAQYEKQTGVALNAEQRDAVLKAVSEGMLVITGGPGTGKTTSINCILRLMSALGETALAAPTGRAAKRLSEATGGEAKTLHRLLEYGGGDDEGVFARGADNPLEVDALIVDEMSMVDIFLMQSLLLALKPGARLIMVGDADQLPSVGAGNVLRDVIASLAVPTVRLTEIFRQAQESTIVVNAHRINHGQPPLLNQKGSDFFIQRVPGPRDVGSAVIGLIRERLPAFTGADPLRDIQVLSPMKKGDAGVWHLNKLLQTALNPESPDKPQRLNGDTLYRLGDKVMQVKNNYETEWTRRDEQGQGVFNGDVGFITAIDNEEQTIQVSFDDDRVAQYDDMMMDELELAYCVSVHKSQGSEFPCVVMPCVQGPPMLMTRNLLYTAVTRARKLVVLVGQDEIAARMAGNNHILRRYSGLHLRMSEVAQILKTYASS